MEKMTISEALDERDYLAVKISKAIDKLNLITCKREKDPKTSTGLTAEEFIKKGSSDFQSVIDQIDRYKRINVAITISNANTIIKLRSGEEMSVAEAISRKKMLSDHKDFEQQLCRKLDNEYLSFIRDYTRLKNSYETTRNSLMESLISSSHVEKLDESQISSIDVMTNGDIPQEIDSLKNNNGDITTVIDQYNDKLDNILKEINSAIKISNATTEIEF